MGTAFAGRTQTHAAINGVQVEGIAKAGQAIFRRTHTLYTLTNLIGNGSFETDATGWTPSSNTITRQPVSPAHSEYGSYAGQLTYQVNGAIYITSANLPVVNGRAYYLRALVRTLNTSYNTTAQLYNNATALSPAITASGLTTTGWTLLDGIWTANTTSLALRLQFSGGGGNQTRGNQFDNIMLVDLSPLPTTPALADLRTMIAAAGGYWNGSLTLAA